jgi:hypothetical protein
VDDALALLDRVRRRGPHSHAVLVRLYEQLGIAYAYLEREPEALAAFDRLLALSPGHLLSYTLSPKATFVFERARKSAAGRPAPTIDVRWPRNADVSEPLPVDIEVVTDPPGFLHSAQLHVRTRGAAAYATVDLELPVAGDSRRVLLPAVASGRPEVLQLFLTAFDGDGNEVLQWADPVRPRELPLGYEAPQRWYRQWWVWAVAGSVLAAGTGVTVYLLSREPSGTIGGVLDVGR